MPAASQWPPSQPYPRNPATSALQLQEGARQHGLPGDWQRLLERYSRNTSFLGPRFSKTGSDRFRTPNAKHLSQQLGPSQMWYSSGGTS